MAKATYIHLANDGGIFAVRGTTGEQGWITRAILIDELNTARQDSLAILLSADQPKELRSQIVAESQALVAGFNLEIVLSPRVHPSAVQKDGLTTLMKAAYVGREDLIRDLIKRGADLSARDIAGYTALMCSAYAGKLGSVKLLIGGGAELNADDLEGSTALMFAAQNGHGEIVEVLVRAGANPDMKGKSDFTAADFATQNGHSRIAEFLLKRAPLPL